MKKNLCLRMPLCSLLFSLLLLLSPLQNYAQEYITGDPNGGFFVMDHFQGSMYFGDTLILGDSVSSPKSGFFASVDSNAHIRWIKEIPLVENTYSITSDGDGNVYVAASFSPSLQLDTLVLNSCPGENRVTALVKLRSDGSLVWWKNVCPSSFISALNTSVDAAGNVFLTGAFHRDSLQISGFSAITGPGSGLNTDMFAAKFDSSGNPIWLREINDPDPNFDFNFTSMSSTCDPAGNLYISAGFGDIRQGNATFQFAGTTLTASSAANRSTLVFKYTPSGGEDWVLDFSGNGQSGENFPEKIVAGPGGSIYLTGRFYSPLFPPNHGPLNMNGGGSFFAAMNPAGQWRWVTQLPTGNTSWFTLSGLCVGPSGNVFLSGYGSGELNLPGTNLMNVSYGTSFLANWDSSGTLQCLDTFPLGTVNWGGEGLAVDGQGNAYQYAHKIVHPVSRHSVVEGWKKNCSLAWDTLWTNQNVNPIMSRAPFEHEPEWSVAVFPMPADLELTCKVTGNRDSALQLSLLDVQGRVLLQQKLPSGNTSFCTLDVSSIPSGIYILRVASGTEWVNRKVVIQ